LSVGTSQDIGISNENLLSICFDLLFPSLALAQESTEKPEVPVNKRGQERILLVGAHADGAALARHPGKANRHTEIKIAQGVPGPAEIDLREPALMIEFRHGEITVTARQTEMKALP
jgi:hypothetical protein